LCHSLKIPFTITFFHRVTKVLVFDHRGEEAKQEERRGEEDISTLGKLWKGKEGVMCMRELETFLALHYVSEDDLRITR